ncbi:PA0069 family radical SAM protein [Halocola ammonii]
MSNSKKDIHGRGAQHNPHNRFEANQYLTDEEYLEYCHLEGEEPESNKTNYLEVFPKSIISKNNSPDIGFNYSINPYQGCEHGCVYCYARNSHEYWGYSAGRDFEKNILIKKNAPELLEKAFASKSYKPEIIVISGNTDCYQPAERKFQLTRQLLKTCLRHRHPVGLITKNSLILRDLDLLRELNERGLLRVTISITSLDESLRRVLEPRTASVKQRLKTVEVLSQNGIAVNVNMAPIIPGMNNHEVFKLVEEVGKRGAKTVSYIMVRLNGQIAEIFEKWVEEKFPDRSEKIINQIKATHSGTLNESRWKTRMKGEGRYAEQVKQMVELARKQFLPKWEKEPLNFDDFIPRHTSQLKMF